MTKTLVIIAVEKRGRAFGRTRMAVIAEASKDALCGFVQRCMVLGSTVRTDGWAVYLFLKDSGDEHDRVAPRNKPQTPSQLLPGVRSPRGVVTEALAAGDSPRSCVARSPFVLPR